LTGDGSTQPAVFAIATTSPGSLDIGVDGRHPTWKSALNFRANLMDANESELRTRPSLLLRIRDRNDEESWRTFSMIYAPLVYRYCCRQGLQDADAADLSQVIMEKVARAIRSFEYQPARGLFRNWVLTITRRQVAKFRRHAARRPEQSIISSELEQLGADSDRPDADWNQDFTDRVLQVALDRSRPSFEPTTWRAFESVWIENRSAAETADALSLRIELVYYSKARVLKRLQEDVEEIVEDFSCMDCFWVTK
jgi:RNA polymerase sigma factor (sigma-70 family)